ncbi:MAG: phytoene desaturase family protein [Planctomycetota bacterium]
MPHRPGEHGLSSAFIDRTASGSPQLHAASRRQTNARTMPKRVLILGAGPGGLASAMLLAKAGLDVTLVERRDQPGGRTSTVTLPSERGDFRFDLGPTFFLFPQVLAELFEACDLRLDQAVELTRLDPQYRLIFETGGDLPCTADPDVMAERIARISPADVEGFRRYLLDNRKKFSAFAPILQKPWSSPLQLLDPKLAAMLPLVRPWASVDSDLRKHFSDPRIRLAFSFQSKYLGMSPFQCPSLFTILSYLEYDYGVWHPTGGCGAVSRAMAHAAESLGVDIRYEAEVAALNFEGAGRACTGVTLQDGESIDADALVLGADFAHAMHKLVPDTLRKRWTDRKLAKKRYSCSTYMLYLGVEGTYDTDHHSIFLADGYQQNLHDIETGHVLSDNPSCYVCNPTVTDPSMAPEGCSALYVLAPVSHEHANIDWSRDEPAFRQRVLKQLGKFGFDGVEDRIVCERTITPVDWRSDLHIYRGATFNLAHNLKQMLHLRPNNRFEDLQNVYLTGGGTHPGSGLPVIYESARISSRLLLQDLGLDAQFLDDTMRPPAPWAPEPGVAVDATATSETAAISAGAGA